MIHPSETVCLTANADTNLYAVGSQSHISVVDPRRPGVVHVADSCDEGWGVRALDFKSHIITTGGGHGRVGFYDMRAHRFLDGFENGTTKRQFLEIGQGWMVSSKEERKKEKKPRRHHHHQSLYFSKTWN